MRKLLPIILLFVGFNVQAQFTLQDFEDFLDGISEFLDEDFQTHPRTLLAKASADECYFPINSTIPAPYDVNNYFPQGLDCVDCINKDGIPKVNQAYVWGMTKSGNKLFYGTAPNVQCLVIGQFFGLFIAPSPSVNDLYTCEFDQSDYTSIFNGTALGDWRPPRVYSYDVLTNEQVELTSQITGPGATLLQSTIGIRSAGSTEDIVFYAGPAVLGQQQVGIAMYAFNATSMDYIGATALTDYTNIRKWLYHNGELYAAVGTSDGGHVLKWTGDLGNPFQFDEVGDLDGEGAELEVHNDHMYVTTWPAFGSIQMDPGSSRASLFMSPPVGAGLSDADAGDWEKVWIVDNYEPDTVIGSTYGGGALASFDGHLYWGTMHVPFFSTAAHFALAIGAGDINSTEEAIVSFFASSRALSIFRAEDFPYGDGDLSPTHTQEIELVYGSPVLPAFRDGDWELVGNNLPFPNSLPIKGLPGFGNPFNNYTWAMDVWNNDLYIGTMDHSILLFGSNNFDLPMDLPFNCQDIFNSTMTCDSLEAGYDIFRDFFDPNDYFGADLWRIENADAIGFPESFQGLGNPLSYGIRTMIADGDQMYLGMANPMNLISSCEEIPSDARVGPQTGGWELIRLGPQFGIPTLTQWGIMILSLLVVIFGVQAIRKQVKELKEAN